MADDPLSSMQQTVARMEGMLTVVISNHSSRLESHDILLAALVERQGATNSKVGELTVTIAGIRTDLIATNAAIERNRGESKASHDKDIKDVQTEVDIVKANQAGQLSKALVIITPIIAIAGFILAMGDRLYT